MKIYLSARYPRREEILRYRSQLQEMGHEVTSRWLIEEPLEGEPDNRRSAFELHCLRFATQDFSDLVDADGLIAFTDPSPNRFSRGGRHIEFGVALGLVKPIILIGPRENIFHHLPGVAHFVTWEHCLKNFPWPVPAGCSL
ncbi:MAG: hypothetical protein ACKVT0_03430 [Planctomycetaceae bacterium]